MLKLVRTVTIWYEVDETDYPGMSEEEIIRYETDEVDTVDILRQSDNAEITTISYEEAERRELEQFTRIGSDGTRTIIRI